MFSLYQTLLQNITNFFSKGLSTSFSILDYLTVILSGILLVGSFAAVIALMVYSIKLPIFVYRKLIVADAAKMRELQNDNSLEETYRADAIRLVANRIHKRVVLYWSGIVIIYIPIMIPTILVVFDVIFGCF